MAQQEPFVVQAFAGEDKFAHQISHHPLRRTLRLAWELVGGVPSAYVGIRYKGRLIAALETDWRGELAEVDIYAEQRYPGVSYPVTLVTPINPRSDIFRGVFAG
jgi:hypothetical protein